ncbi:hypothetical protein SLEP1_g23386 [Rubroshorea leprosula]|uniref:Senescence regulator S40 n=1 Tax=Rubroshorea leprosula TaxID=152421 RepID=A0AAV5JF97_9ROSI|nr:hypothetical protein SLEP1_g23386 [Rubroshorea leprosula]
MASRNSFFLTKPSYIYPTTESETSFSTVDNLEFQEADFWSSVNETAAVVPMDGKKQQVLTSRSSKRSARGSDRSGLVAPSSVPVNVPDWSKILKEEYRERRHRDSDDDADENNDEDDQDSRVPPHEFLARRRGASFSVHEGIGRTLKGRDLRRVRNAIWKKTGFED